MVSLRSGLDVLDLSETDLGRLKSLLVPASAVLGSLALTSSLLSKPSAPLLLSTMS